MSWKGENSITMKGIAQITPGKYAGKVYSTHNIKTNI